MGCLLRKVAADVFSLSALAACGVADVHEDAAGTEDEAVATAEEAAEPAVALPYQTKFQRLWNHLETKNFIVPRHTSLHVIVTTWWSDPPSPTFCASRRLLVSLHYPNGVLVGGARPYRTDGRMEGGSFQNVAPGTYHLELDVIPPLERCKLVGGLYIEG